MVVMVKRAIIQRGETLQQIEVERPAKDRSLLAIYGTLDSDSASPSPPCAVLPLAANREAVTARNGPS
jgi:hypothetical protein